MQKRHTISPFNLSFLDIMFCGFGAVVLLVLILDSNTVQARREAHADLRGQVLSLEKRLAKRKKSLSETQQRLVSTRQALARGTREAKALSATLATDRGELQRLGRETGTSRERLEGLETELKSRAGANRQLRTRLEDQPERGTRIRRFAGEGDRQYLTGLKVGGKRILILLDTSASMLDDTLVNIIRLRNMDDASKRRAEKWQRALRTLEWLVANLPPGSRFQIYSFDVRARPAIPAPSPSWLKTDDADALDEVVRRLRELVPQGGTSLYHAFSLARQLQPAPDNILLVTDGLPTQGRSKPVANKVSAEQRLAHFETAVRRLPKGIPVNTILLPMEGDAYAAAAFWQLAVATRGSFMTPSRDWP